MYVPEYNNKMKMHNLRNYLLFGLLALIIHGRLPAQSNKAWTLEECINYARSRNINVKKQLLNVQLQKDQLNQSKLATLPTLNGNASHVYNWGQTIDPFTNQFATERVRSNNFYISTQMTLFNGFQKLNTIRRNQLALRISEIEVERMMNDISLNVVTFYLQGLYAIEVLKRGKPIGVGAPAARTDSPIGRGGYPCPGRTAQHGCPGSCSGIAGSGSTQ